MSWRESTTTSLSGKHLGIYRAIYIAIEHELEVPTNDNKTAIEIHKCTQRQGE
jgi:hypothetical protein